MASRRVIGTLSLTSYREGGIAGWRFGAWVDGFEGPAEWVFLHRGGFIWVQGFWKLSFIGVRGGLVFVSSSYDSLDFFEGKRNGDIFGKVPFGYL